VVPARAPPTTQTATLLRFGANWRELVWRGEVWRLATSMFLHIGLLHLVWNGWFGFRLCSVAESALGPWRFLLLYLASGIVGSAASVIGHDAVSAGASGALFGLIGWRLFELRRASGSFKAFVEDPGIRKELTWIGMWFVLGAFAGFDNYAHGGGLVMGALVGWAVGAGAPPGPARWRRPALAAAIGLAIVAGALRPLPLHHGQDAALQRALVAWKDPKAVIALTEPLLASPRRDAALTLRAPALLALRRFEEAGATPDELIAIDPANAKAYAIRGAARAYLQYADGARTDLDKAVALAPGDRWIRDVRDWLGSERSGPK
jgi:membrane associated rhomboid family serine protease